MKHWNKYIVIGIFILLSNKLIDYSQTTLKFLILILGASFSVYGLVIFFKEKKIRSQQVFPTYEKNGELKSKPNSKTVDRTKWTGENFEFLITGDIEIPNENYDQIMTPNSFEWEKVFKDEWPFYRVGKDEFSFSWEIPGIQFTFNKEVKYEKAKNIADEIIENLHSIGQKAELLTLEKNKVYKF